MTIYWLHPLCVCVCMSVCIDIYIYIYIYMYIYSDLLTDCFVVSQLISVARCEMFQAGIETWLTLHQPNNITLRPQQSHHKQRNFNAYVLISFCLYFCSLAQWVECSPIVRETGVPSQDKSYQRLKKWYLIPPCSTLSIIRYVSRVK